MQLDNFLKANPEIKKIGEIGFNVGMSSFTSLNARPDIEVMSFDLGSHPHISSQKNIIDEIFPRRHILMIGDSRISLPTLKTYHPEPIFDMMIVDGGHDDDVPYLDIVNSLALVKPSGWIYIDDVCTQSWGINVTKATSRAIHERIICDPKYYESSNRGWLIANKPHASSTNPNPDADAT
jgi:predicted O-methyltransferase YrrM